MKVETDLVTINLVGKQKEKENWKFRAYLKGLDIEADELDNIVHKLNKEVTSQIDCTKCANCCKVIYPFLDEEDVTKFSLGLGVTIEEFKSTSLIVSEEEDKYKFNSFPCPYLKENRCSNYINRPKDCESFPHLHKEEFWTRLMGVVEFYSICPIVFNVYERLKKELWRRDWRKRLL
jgi:Fe-S-cluster containining protein